jgi:hypothetical protein
MAKLAKGMFPVAGKMIVKDERKKADARVAAATRRPVVAALPDEEEQRRKGRKDAALRFGQRGSGRASTILSDEGKLGA